MNIVLNWKENVEYIYPLFWLTRWSVW